MEAELDPFLRTKEVVRLTGLSKTTLWRRERAGRFPQRITLGGNLVVWRQAEIKKWLTDPVGYQTATPSN